jgi:hypothetical protein
MDSRAEEAEDITKALFTIMQNSPKNLVVISVDLPTSGYAENLDYDLISALGAIGSPKWTPLPFDVPIPAELGPFFLAAFAAAGLPAPPPIIPAGTPLPDFAASGRTPLLDFIETFVVRFAETLDGRVPVIKNNIKAVMGGSLGGNIAFRLGRRPAVPWLPRFIVWSPASIWDSLGGGADITKHIAPRSAWESANNRALSEQTSCLRDRLLVTDQTRRGIDNVAANNGQANGCDQLVVKYDGADWWWGALGKCKQPGGTTDRTAIFNCAWAQVPAGDPNDLSPARLGLRRDFFGGWDKPIIPFVIPAQSETWTSDYYQCKKSSVAAARLDRHETYDPRFLAWHWRLGGEQLLYSHQTIDPAKNQRLYMSNDKLMLLACGVEDNIKYNDICGATQRTAPYMTMTPGKALFLDKTGHSLDNERPGFWAQQIVQFLRLF